MHKEERTSYEHVATTSINVESINVESIIHHEIDEKAKEKSNCCMISMMNYNCVEKIVSFLIIFLGVSAFCVPIYKWIETGDWISNPFNSTLDRIPYVNIVTIHVFIALFWSICLPFQLISGLYTRDCKAAVVDVNVDFNINKYKKYKQFHKIFGLKLAPIALISYLGLAMVLIGLRWNVLSVGFLYVNILGAFGMILFFISGMYNIYKKNPDIEKHRDCMMHTILFSFSPAMNRIIQYIFYFIHWIIFGNISFHPNDNLLVVFGAIFVFIITIPLQYKRIYKAHNVVVLGGALFALVVFSLLVARIIVIDDPSPPNAPNAKQ